MSTTVVAASAAVVAARNSVDCSSTGSQLSVLATLKALDDANDVTEDMQTAICASVVKQAAMSANLDEDEITCKQDVAGVPVKVRILSNPNRNNSKHTLNRVRGRGEETFCLLRVLHT